MNNQLSTSNTTWTLAGNNAIEGNRIFSTTYETSPNITIFTGVAGAIQMQEAMRDYFYTINEPTPAREKRKGFFDTLIITNEQDTVKETI